MNVSQKKTAQLLKKGVAIPKPESVEIGAEVDIERISGDDVHIHAGSKIFGKSTLIMAHSQIGLEAPVTIQDCQIGPQVALKGGYFKNSVFLTNTSAGSGSHVREGCIFEEEASIAHTVGLKQTILFPFVTLGSLINFCDALMAGGTSRKNHTEIGSAYIHFNFTPNQDKATPSLIGDVPNGVMLDQAPIFLGGQGGLVGPSRIAYGTIIAAGTIFRKDETRPGRMIFGGMGKGGNVPHVSGLYRGIKRILINNCLYIGNLISLLHWYQDVRSIFISNTFPQALWEGVLEKLHINLEERMDRLEQLAHKMPESIQKYEDIHHKPTPSKMMAQQQELFDKCDAVTDCLRSVQVGAGDPDLKAQFLQRLLAAAPEKSQAYIPSIQSLDPETKQIGRNWLQSIVDQTLSKVLEILPSFR